jgi:hypothetical protein
VGNISAWSHTEQLWRCSKRGTPLVKIWEEENSKYAGLAQQNGFGPAFLDMLLRGWQRAQSSLTHALDWLDILISR